MIKIGKVFNIFPNYFIASVENMCSIFMNHDSFLISRINISSYMGAFFHNETRAITFVGFMGKDGSKKSRTNNEIVKHHSS